MKPDSLTNGTNLWPSIEAYFPQHAQAVVDQEVADDRTAVAKSLEALADCGYYGLAIPKEFGGHEASVLECCAVQRRLGAQHPGLAVGLNMHLFSVGVIVEHWRKEQDLVWMMLEAIATQRRLVASGFAEPGLAGVLSRSHCVATKVEGGYRLFGRKVPCSLAARCDLLCLQAECPETNELLVMLIAAQGEGVTVQPTWDALGMEASASDEVVIEDCFVPDELVFHRGVPGEDSLGTFAAGLIWFSLTATATYLGVAAAALDLAASGLARATVPPAAIPRASMPSYVNELGDTVAAVAAHEAALVGVAERFDRTHSPDLLPWALAVKQQSVALIPEVVGKCAEVAGAGTYSASHPMASLLRHCAAIRFHPPTRPVVRQALGQWFLGYDLHLELVESPLTPSAGSNP